MSLGHKIVVGLCLGGSLLSCKWFNEGEREREKKQEQDTVSPDTVPPDNKKEQTPSQTAKLQIEVFSKGVVYLKYRNSVPDIEKSESFQVKLSLEDKRCIDGEVVYVGKMPDPLQLDLRIEVEPIKRKSIELCLVLSKDNSLVVQKSSDVSSTDLAAPIEGAPDIINYGRVCREAIGPIPNSSCLDGEVIPITVDGIRKDSLSENSDCDNPIGLLMPEGQCVGGSRLVTIESLDPDVRVVMICRRYTVKPLSSPMFEDISIIQHRISTGATCFYQMPLRDSDGSKVPSPTEWPESPIEGGLLAETFWLSPKDAAERVCVECHDSDPFIYNPWISQVSNLPKNPKGKYVILGEDFADWPIANAIDTKSDNSCTSCHRIGNMYTCGTMSSSVGQEKLLNQLSTRFRFPEAYWMPPDHGLKQLAEWESKYKRDFDAISSCCEDPTLSHCESKPITVNRGH